MFFRVAVTETTSPAPVTEIGDGYGDPRAGPLVVGTVMGAVLQTSWVTRPLNVTELSTDVDASLSPPAPVAAPAGNDSTTVPEVVIPETDAV